MSVHNTALVSHLLRTKGLLLTSDAYAASVEGERGSGAVLCVEKRVRPYCLLCYGRGEGGKGEGCPDFGQTN